MNQKTIDVILLENDEGKDTLRFVIDEEQCLDINLNSETCQAEIKIVFEKILGISTTEDIQFDYSVKDGYTKQLYIDVCAEYIKEIQREINNSISQIRAELSLSE